MLMPSPMPRRTDDDRSRAGWANLEGYSLRSPNLVWLPMDGRLILVVAPILLAASWAVFHIGRAAVGQLQLLLKRARA
jgi:photosystem II PsbY protein